MKKAKLGHGQRSIMGGAVLLAAALMFGVTVNAALRGTDEGVRGTGESGSEVTRLVTGDPAQFNAVVAGTPPTAILAVNPVPVPTGVTPPNPYPPGTIIVGNELRAEVGGFRAWFNAQVSDWDPNGDGPNLAVYQVRVDCAYFEGVNADPPNPGVDLALAVVACSGADPTPCVNAFGESWAPCSVYGAGDADDYCDAAYLDSHGTGRPDSWCAPNGGACAATLMAFGSCNFGGGIDYGAVSNLTTGHPDEPSTCVGGVRSGGGCSVAGDCPPPGTCTGPRPVYYGGTLVLDIPAGAMGRYTVFLDQEQTFVASPGTPPVLIETLEENGFVVKVGTGQCCYGLGTTDAGCIDSVLRAECGDDEPDPVLFILGESCSPQGPDCSSYFGACCDTLNGSCQDSVMEADCQGTHRVWTSGTSCGDAACIADTGACCDHDPFGACTDDTVLSDCQCPTCTWYKLQACTEIECAPTPIPTVSEWGLAILTLLLLTAAKVYFGRSVGEPRFVTPHRD